MTTPPDHPDPWGAPPGGPPPAPPGYPSPPYPQAPPPPPPPGPGYGAQQPAWGAPPGQPQPPPNWPVQGQPGDWSAPGYGNWAGGGTNNGMGTAGLVLGIVGVLLSWTSLGGLVLGGLAIVFGTIGRGRARRREADNGGTATAGFTLGIIAVVLGVIFGVAIYQVVMEEQRQYEACIDAGNPEAYCETVYEPAFE